MNTPQITDALNAIAGKDVHFELQMTARGTWAVVAELTPAAIATARATPNEFKGMIQSVAESVVALAAAAFFAENKSVIFQALSPEAIANLALADAARMLREDIIDPKRQR